MLALIRQVVDLVLSMARLVLLTAVRLVAQLVPHQEIQAESSLKLSPNPLRRSYLAARSSAEALTYKVQGHSMPVLILPGHLDQPAARGPVVDKSASRELEAYLPLFCQSLAMFR
jgi:hypothetical protein